MSRVDAAQPTSPDEGAMLREGGREGGRKGGREGGRGGGKERVSYQDPLHC